MWLSSPLGFMRLDHISICFSFVFVHFWNIFTIKTWLIICLNFLDVDKICSITIDCMRRTGQTLHDITRRFLKWFFFFFCLTKLCPHAFPGQHTANQRHFYSRCKVEHFNMGSIEIWSLLEPTPSGQLRNCNNTYFLIVFNLVVGWLPHEYHPVVLFISTWSFSCTSSKWCKVFHSEDEWATHGRWHTQDWLSVERRCRRCCRLSILLVWESLNCESNALTYYLQEEKHNWLLCVTWQCCSWTTADDFTVSSVNCYQSKTSGYCLWEPRDSYLVSWKQITVFDISSEEHQEIDVAILRALLQGQYTTPR